MKKVAKYKAKIRALRDKITQIRDSCPHCDYTRVGKTTDHDGWSKTWVRVFEKRHCNDCGANFQVQTHSKLVNGVFH